MKKTNYIFAGGNVVTPDRVLKYGVIIVEDGTIKSVTNQASGDLSGEQEKIDCAGKTVMPGFIDVHTHGGAGFDFKDDTPEAFDSLSEFYYSHGVTSLLATLAPLSYELLVPAIRRLVKYIKGKRGDTNIVGIHLEGPYINRSMSGGNKKEYIEPPDFDRWREVLGAGEGLIRLMTVAPELNGIERIIGDAVKHGIIIALGHSSAKSNVASKAVALGAKQVTHIFNSMPGLHHRDPGLLAVALVSDDLDAQLIADGIHVHPEVVRLAVKVKSPRRVILITDSMRAAGLADGEYDSAGNTVTVSNGISRLPDGTLAGSTLTFEKGFQLIAGLPGIDLSAASMMTSLNAARSLGMDAQTGSIQPGKRADFAVLNENFGVEMTVRNGNVVYRNPTM